ncbi:MarR family transcriptional regulator [Nocardia panacis]|uniref:MarR family transcriptional regulator n=1 Tax=Nocardia panacis TaxID=2340916 RepID=A0A3A4KC75_9NOCA|nr:MarR family transcriptional regulator [Nocardia panacis]RJO77718.1 MarR family transcriptional regulator [Nocardia panacis]
MPAHRTVAIDTIQRELTAFARRARGTAAALHPGLSLVAFSILDLIIERDGCQATDLAERYHLDKSTISRQVTALAELGYLTREVDNTNRRNNILRPTTEGKRVAREAEQVRHEVFEERLHDWSDTDVARFAEYLRRYNAG